jgi:hypothetical protein
MRLRRLVPVLLVLGWLPMATVQAQFDKEFKSWYPHIAVGYNKPLDETRQALTDGYSINGGATYKPSSWPLGIIMDLGYTDYRIKSERLYTDGGERIASGGDVDIWSLTGGGIWAPTSGGKVGFYLSAALGVYRVKARLTEPGTGCGLCCDPFRPWWCWTCCGGVTVVTDSETATEFGGNVAAGVTLRVTDMGSTLFLECKYSYINTEREAIQYVPISVGYRW